MRKQENIQHGILIQTENVHSGKFNSAVDQTNNKEEFRFRIFLKVFEIERARHRVLNYEVENLTETVVNWKFDHLIMQLCLQIAKLKQNERRTFFAGAFANLFFDRCGTWRNEESCGIHNYLRHFRLKFPPGFLLELNTVCKNVENAFWQISAALRQSFL